MRAEQRASHTATGAAMRRRSLRARGLRVLGMVLGVLVVACAGKDLGGPAYAGYNHQHAERLFAVGYQDIRDIYIDEVALSELALGGLKRLPAIDRDLGITRRDGSVVLTYRGESRSFPLPTQADPDAWADLTADVIDSARDYSKAVEATPAAGLYETVFTGIFRAVNGKVMSE